MKRMEFAESAPWNDSLAPLRDLGVHNLGAGDLGLGHATPPLGRASQPTGLLRTSAAPSANSGLNLVFIDRQVQDAGKLIQDTLTSLAGETLVYLLDPLEDAIAQITQTLLAQTSPIAGVHLLSHGSAGQLLLGQNWLGAENLATYQAQIQTWSQVLTADADLLLYGCEVGQDRSFLQALSVLTQADVAASTNVTGGAGDWILEVQTGAIAQAMVSTDYQHELVLQTELLSQSDPNLASDSIGGNLAATSSATTVSGDGRYVVFSSRADNIVTLDSNGAEDVFLFDRTTQTYTLVSRNQGGTNAGNAASFNPVISRDGNFVAFTSRATNLSADTITNNPTNTITNVFLWNRSTNTTQLLSQFNSIAGNDNSSNALISETGNTVTFTSTARNLSSLTDNSSFTDIFVWRSGNPLALVTVNPNSGEPAAREPGNVVMSANGNFIAFTTTENFTPEDSNNRQDVFRYEVTSQAIELVSFNQNGLGSTTGLSERPSISDDGGRIAFASNASDLAPNDTNNSKDIFVWEVDPTTSARTIRLVTLNAAGTASGRQTSGFGGADVGVISGDGRFVAFTSLMDDLVVGDTNQAQDVFLRDLTSNTTRIVSQAPGNVAANGTSSTPVINRTGTAIAYTSTANNLAAGDTNGRADIFVYDGTANTTTLASRPAGNLTGVSVGGVSAAPFLSADGNTILFNSGTSDLVPKDNNNAIDVFAVNWRSNELSLITKRDTSIVSVTGNGVSEVTAQNSVSEDGRYVVFTSNAGTLVPNDQNGFTDIFLRDTTLPATDPNATRLISRTLTGASGDRQSSRPVISRDGNFVVFESSATNLVTGDTNNFIDLFLYDRRQNTVQLISRPNATSLSNGDSTRPSVSADGLWVTFVSTATNLVAGSGANGTTQNVYLVNTTSGEVRLLSRSATGSGNGNSSEAIVSGDGRFVAFVSDASNLAIAAGSDANNASDIFVYDIATNTLQLVSVGATGQGNGRSFNPVLSRDGRYLAFVSEATNLATGDANGTQDVFRRDLTLGTTALVSVNTSGNGSGSTPGNGATSNRGSINPVISDDGRYIAFSSTAIDLTSINDRNAQVSDVFWRDMQTGVTELISINRAGTASGDAAGDGSRNPVLSGDGRFVAFTSTATDLVTTDSNGAIADIFVRDTTNRTTLLASLNRAGTSNGNGASRDPALSRSGAYLAFTSEASNLIADDFNNQADVFGRALKPTVSLTVLDATASESDLTDTARYELRRDDTAGSLVVRLTVAPASSAQLADFTVTADGGVTPTIVGNVVTIQLAEGQASVQLTLTAVDDIAAEAAEVLQLAVVDDAAYRINSAAASGNATIAANDLVVTNTNDAGEGSLRQAILNANAFTGRDVVTFSITGAGLQTINLLSALPELGATTDIDGMSQTGFTNTPLIRLNGAGITAIADGLVLSGGDSIVKGLAIAGFTGNGIRISSNNNAIGGVAVNEGNVITGNAIGVSVVSGTGNRIAGNSVAQNTGLGIDLGTVGVTPNDLDDSDTGANNLQNFPVLTIAEPTNSGIAVQGTVQASAAQAGQTYRLEFFANTAVDSSDFGEGETYLGSRLVNLDTNGTATFTYLRDGLLPAGTIITATLTDPNGNTSEFSQGLALALPEVSISPVTSQIAEGNAGTNTPVPVTIRLSKPSTQAVQVTLGSANGTATTTDNDYTSVARSITFQPGQTEIVESGTIVGDDRFEPSETFTLTIRDPQNATIATNNTATVTIQNDDLPPLPVLSMTAPQSVLEGNTGTTTYRFSLSLSAASATPVTVEYRTIAGTATAGSDFTAVTNGSVTFAAGVLTQTIDIAVNGDTRFETDETFSVELFNPSGAAFLNGTTFSTSGTIGNDDERPVISIAPVTLARPEGNVGTTEFVYAVNLSNASDEVTTVNYRTVDGTATVTDNDYIAVAATEILTFAPGQTTQNITVQGRTDRRVELTEQFSVELLTPVNGTLSTTQASAIVELQNDDVPPVISITPLTLSQVEGNPGGAANNYVFTVRLSAAAAETVRVNYTTINGTATVADSDYVTNSGTLEFAPGDTEKTVTVVATADTKFEPNETFTVQLSTPVNGTLDAAATTATATITDDDTPTIPTVSIAPLTLSRPEGNTGSQIFQFTVNLSSPAQQAIQVDYTTLDGTALTGDFDYTGRSGTLLFNVGESSKTIDIAVAGDTRPEPNETFQVQLSNPRNATLSSNVLTTATIENDEPPTISMTVAPAAQAEGTGSPSFFDFTVTLSRPVSEAVTVNYTTADDTATLVDGDYTAATGTLTFAPNETSKTVRVQANGDNRPETDETFLLRLSNASGGGAVLETEVVAATLTNDDGSVVPTVSFTSATNSVFEGNSGPAPVGVTVRLSEVSNTPVSVQIATQDGSATIVDQDYQVVNGTLRFAPGVQQLVVFVQVVGDTRVEPNETFQMQLSNPTGVTLGSIASQTVTIANDDVVQVRPVLALAGTPPSLNEGNSGNTPVSFTVSLSQASTERITVQYRTVDGTATTADADYSSATGTLTFEPGQTSQVVTVNALGDTRVESNENFTLELFNATGGDVQLGTATQAATIVNDDAVQVRPVLALAGTPPSLNEGNSGNTPVNFTVSLSQASTERITVQYRTVDGTATTADGDYSSATGTLTFEPGQTSQVVTVNALGDTRVEPNENFTLELFNATGGNVQLGTATQTATIVNDDAVQVRPVLALAGTPPSLNEGNSGNTPVNFTVSLSQASTERITVQYRTVDGTATTADGDYSSATGTLTFEPGQTSQVVTVNALGDTRVESNENFTLELFNATGGNVQLGTATQAATIVNDDVVIPNLVVETPTAVQEGNTGTTAVTFTVRLSQATTVPVSVNYQTANGTATIADGDYSAVNGTLNFAAGQTIQTVTVNINGDTKFEPNETFALELSNPNGATIATGTANATISNDDRQIIPVISIDPINTARAEGAEGAITPLTFTIGLSEATTEVVSVNYSILDGTATRADNDYNLPIGITPTGTVTFNPGETSKTITINAVGDNRIEPDEALSIRLSSPNNGTLATNPIATVTLIDDDRANGINISVDGQSDVVWRNTATNEVVFWNLNNTPTTTQFDLPSFPDRTWTAYGTIDVDRDGDQDVIWRNDRTGQVLAWQMSGRTFERSYVIGEVPSLDWQIVGLADMTGDRTEEIIWRFAGNGQLYYWQLGANFSFQRDQAFPVITGSDWTLESLADFNNDGRTDFLWQNQRDGRVQIWKLQGTAITETVDLLAVPPATGWRIQGAADFSGDRFADILWRNTLTGETVIWQLNDGAFVRSTFVVDAPGADLFMAGIADFNNDGSQDVLWRSRLTGQNILWHLNRTQFGVAILYPNAAPSWEFQLLSDFNGDNQPDLLWLDPQNGATYLWTVRSSPLNAGPSLGYTPGRSWAIVGTADFDLDGNVDILVRDSFSGVNAIWRMIGTKFEQVLQLPTVQELGWQMVKIVDFDRDGDADLLWRNTRTGQNLIWQMDRGVYRSDLRLPTAPVNWDIVGTGDFDSNGSVDIVWRNMSTGENVIWYLDRGTFARDESLLSVPDQSWKVAAIADFNRDGRPDLLWQNSRLNQTVIWQMDRNQIQRTSELPTGLNDSWRVQGARDLNGDGLTDILWSNLATGKTLIWYMRNLEFGTSVFVETYSNLEWRVEGLDDFRSSPQ
jgi:Domain of unknown function (DUF4347)/Calx-beta domain/FG-GAP-like repeat/WD40-like Beta Propeller Repeat